MIIPRLCCRPRHWKALLAVTGQTFDLDPRTFTLGAMFSLQLQRYAEQIGTIVAGAAKELTIEQELGKLAAAWKEQRFEVHPYSGARVRLECMGLGGDGPLGCAASATCLGLERMGLGAEVT